jgi:DNA-binding CsgD family transcriptional regulator
LIFIIGFPKFDKALLFKKNQFSVRIHYYIASIVFCTWWGISCSEISAQNKNSKKSDLEYFADSLVLADKHEEAIEIYQKLLQEEFRTDDAYMNRLHYKIGNSLMLSGKDKQAQPWFQKVLKAVSEKRLKSDAMAALGRTYEYTGNRDSAFYWYLKSYQLAEETADTLRRARGARNMAQLLRVLRRFDEAGNYCQEAVTLIPGISDYKVVANIYNETAYLFELSGVLDSAAHFYWQLIHVSEKNRYKKGESVGYSNLASVLEKQNRYNEALELKQKGLEIDRQIGDVYGAMNSHRGIAETYMLMGDKESAIHALDEAFFLCDTSWIADLSGIHLSYYQLLKSTGNAKDALSHYEKYIELSNRINESKSRETVIDLLAQYETEKKEQQILLLEQANLLKENRLRLQWLVIGVLVLLGVLIAVTAWSVIRHKNQKLNQMKTDLQHFLLHEKKAGNSNQSHQEISVEKWGLTSRESEILHHLEKGCSNAKIAETLFISENTVKFHIKNIYIKLNVKNRMEAVLRCSEN